MGTRTGDSPTAMLASANLGGPNRPVASLLTAVGFSWNADEIRSHPPVHVQVLVRVKRIVARRKIDGERHRVLSVDGPHFLRDTGPQPVLLAVVNGQHHPAFRAFNIQNVYRYRGLGECARTQDAGKQSDDCLHASLP